MSDRVRSIDRPGAAPAISAIVAAVNVAAGVLAFYAAVRFVVWTWVP